MKYRKYFLHIIIALIVISCTNEKPLSQDNYDYSIKRDTIIAHFYGDTFRFIDSVTGSLGKSDTIQFSTHNVVYLDTTEIMDSLARFLHCTATLKYSISEEHIKRIVNELEWFESIKEYEAFIIKPYMRNVIRHRTMISLKPELLNCDSLCQELFTQDASDSLKGYAEVHSFEINFFD